MFVSPTVWPTWAEPCPTDPVADNERGEAEIMGMEEVEGGGEGECVPLVPPPALFKPPHRPLLHIFVSVCVCVCVCVCVVHVDWKRTQWLCEK